MSSQYEPSDAAEPVQPWSVALLSQRDLALAVPINYVTQPAVSLTEACFAKRQYGDDAARRCLSNLLDVGFKRFVVDLYWDAGRGLWSLCPVQIPESASNDDDSTIGIISSTADASLSSVAMSTGSLQARQATALSGSALRSTSQSVSSTRSVSTSSARASPTGQVQGSDVFQASSYTCSASLNVSTISSLIADYLDGTADTIRASVIYLIFNVHAAASNSTTTVPTASQLPTANTTLSNVLSADLASYLYTPTRLREDRVNLNDTWFGYDVASDQALTPALRYLDIDRDAYGTMSTVDGWPGEGLLEFGPDHFRLLTAFGRIDPQMADYDAQADDAILFPEGTFQSIRDVALSDSGNVTNGCFLDQNVEYLTGSTNSSWAMSPNFPAQGSTPARYYTSSPSISNITACGISPLLNQSLSETADVSYEPYQAIVYSSIWSWADNEPRNVTNNVDNAVYLRCATMRLSTHGRWVLTDCTERHHAACRVNGDAPFQWRISDPADSYTDSDSICPEDTAFDAPRTALENSYLFAALQARARENPDDFDGDATVWVNFNSLQVTDCWVVGVGENCPYDLTSKQDENRLALSYSRRAFSTSTPLHADFTHAVIGGGAVGLAIARRLQQKDGVSTVLIERHGSVGTETSSRNSEVIHAGLYYGPDTLKTKLCVKGKEMMYDLCKRMAIPHNNCGKWVVAQDDGQMKQIEKTHEHCQAIGVPTHFLSKDDAKRQEPDVQAKAGILVSPTTGIVDSHSLMQFLEGDFEDVGGICAFASPVTRITPLSSGGNSAPGSAGWEITTKTPEGEESSITAEVLINSAGLNAIALSNSILPPERHLTPAYCKGSYFSYSASHPRPKVLVYPAPRPGLGGLGTHLTLDMGGRIRFGPDVEWVDDPTDLKVSDKNLVAALEDIRLYLPGIDKDAIGLDYAGMRPKLGRAGVSQIGGKGGFQDFYIKKEEGFEGFVNLLGIESPGLTSCLAIGDEVFEILYRR
ncbi:mRNA decay protein [Diplodia seriata]|uniref:L-2-hydroxyglutarate dehydrogenase, mitochondrial n=1 Tax=Diplodia seriata TaxID=420778 RepID=A0ABR3CV01_9PEZI